MYKIIKIILHKISRVVFKTSNILNYLFPTEFKTTSLELALEKNLQDETIQTFSKYFKKSLLFTSLEDIRKHVAQVALLNDTNKEYYNLEFGTWKGESSNFFSKYLKKLYTFDSFEGLSEDWKGTYFSRGHFNLNKKIPKLNSNVEPIVGWVDDTLEGFLKKHNPKINFVHLDLDTYTPTKYVLEKLKPYLVKGSIILFDELYGHMGWKEGEYKSLNEVFKEEDYEYNAFNLRGCQVAIRIK